ncbi:glycoside hydrolase family 19 protein [Deinococcus sp. 6YEL10]|nr:glycoside hydrolase family 19 protein [Deinococcus sp. 6YEL10]
MIAARKAGLISGNDARDRRRMAHFLSQLLHESGLRPVSENLNYSATRLMQVWPSRFTPALAQSCARKPERIANVVYAGRMGNDAPGDGYRYRGRGYIQLTGKYNYAKYGKATGYDLVGNPDLLLQIGVGLEVACAYFVDHGCLVNADRGGYDQVDEITLKINGGYNGLDDRRAKYLRVAALLGVK